MDLVADRANYAKFIAEMRQEGWTDSDVKEYADSIKMLMGDDDDKALALFPAGTYATAEAARADARKFWSDHA